MNFSDFREEIVRLIRQAKVRLPASHIHLVYAPEISDPLHLAEDARRDTALIRVAGRTDDWPEQSLPRIVTLDCRRVAGYLLETDPGIDDPILESSISHAHSTVFLDQVDELLLLNENPGLVRSPVCGWIIAPYDAKTLARRLGTNLRGANNRGNALRWYDPDFMVALWPILSQEQQHAILDTSEWITCNATNGILQFKGNKSGQPDVYFAHRLLNSEQLQVVDNIGVVNSLLLNWKTMCEVEDRVLPKDATQQMHRHVQEGQRYGLDSDDLAIFTMTAVQLAAGATAAPEFKAILERMKDECLALRQALKLLPDIFWQRYQPIAPQGKK